MSRQDGRLDHGDRDGLVISPPTRWDGFKLQEIWAYRELLFFLAWRDIKVRYKQTVLGIAWAVLQPVFAMVVFSIFLGKLGGIPSDGLPYPIFTYCALIPWQLFSHALSESSNSLVTNQNLIRKVYFPRILVPVSTVLAGLLDFLLAFAVLIGLMFVYGIFPGGGIWSLPLLIGVTIISALGVGIWFAALNVRYRDIRYTIPFLTQLWLFATPIAYPSSLVPDAWKALYGLNPMVGVVEGFRWALLGKESPAFVMVAVSCTAALCVLVSGIVYFRKVEDTFADII